MHSLARGVHRYGELAYSIVDIAEVALWHLYVVQWVLISDFVQLGMVLEGEHLVQRLKGGVLSLGLLESLC